MDDGLGLWMMLSIMVDGLGLWLMDLDYELCIGIMDD